MRASAVNEEPTPRPSKARFIFPLTRPKPPFALNSRRLQLPLFCVTAAEFLNLCWKDRRHGLSHRAGADVVTVDKTNGVNTGSGGVLLGQMGARQRVSID